MLLLAQAPPDFAAFNLDRFVWGDQPWFFLLEIVVRTALIYGYVLLLLRFLGKRGMGSLTPFDQVIIISLGSAVGDPMFYPDVPLLHAMTAVTMIVLLQRGLIMTVDRSDLLQRFLASQPARFVIDGCMELEKMKCEHFDREELFMSLREAGVEQLGEVKWAYLEPSGRVSVRRFPTHDVRPGLPVLPPYDDECPNCLRKDERAANAEHICCWTCGQTIRVSAGDVLPACARCSNERWTPAAAP